MIFEMTEKQYQLFLHVMQVMQTFYGNNFSSICKEVGDAYGVNDVDIEKAYMIFNDFKVTAPVPTMQNAAGEIYQTALAADLLIPQLRKLRVGWNGNFGISNAGLAYNSKLAYEMLKAILYACRQGDGTVLKVTDEPLMYAPCKSNIHAL